MSTIRNALLALLTQGPAYGLQLRNELDRRLHRARATNVGQIYSTLDRLVASSLVHQVSTTNDGLPLYELTPAGRGEADDWLTEPRLDAANRWESMVAQVTIARSLPDISSVPLIHGMRRNWIVALSEAQERYQPELTADLRSSAEEQLCLAAIAWLERVDKTDDSGFPVSRARPPRGRPVREAPATRAD